ncbi:hypothetical protein C0J52_09308 [Blattella germanica]|nr:hypothetical protein C0J52_09308 [Blattella germanica]
MGRTYKKHVGVPVRRNYRPENLHKAAQEVKAGLIPFNPNHVISKLPDSEESPEANKTHWSESFEDILKDCRYKKATPAKRKKKLDIPAGTSVLAHHLPQEEDEASLSDSSSSNTSITGATEMSAKATETQDDETIELEEETFLVANYEYKKGNNTCIRQFVGVATKIGAKDVDVMFLRQYNNSKQIFVFPPVADEDTIPKDKIAALLRPPKVEKGKFTFDKEVF